MSLKGSSAPTSGPPSIAFRRRVVEGLLWRLPRIGVDLRPYVLVQEGEVSVTLPDLPEPLHADWATEADVDALDALWAGYDGVTRAMLLERFREGKRCLAVWDGNAVIAATWCDLQTISHRPERRALADHEVYLFSAYVTPAARGRNLAPLMRSLCYEACRAMGRTTMLSTTEYFNDSSHRFKAKLGARWLHVAVEMTLLGRWSRSFLVRRYETRDTKEPLGRGGAGD